MYTGQERLITRTPNLYGDLLFTNNVTWFIANMKVFTTARESLQLPQLEPQKLWAPFIP